jgi:uncharacterized membrane protein
LTNESAELSGILKRRAAFSIAKPVDFVRGLTWLEWIAAVAIAAGLVCRLLARPHAPFWLDEAATGAILSQQNFSGFWRELYWEVSSPFYFLVMRPWAALAGLSNEALRFPSTLFSVAAPLCVLFWRTHGLSRIDRTVWAALVALWIPGIGYGQDARCYSLELLLAALQTLAFIRLLERTSLGATAWWVAFCALTTATHYDAAILAVTQGLFFVALKRWQAVKSWPALLLTAPVVAMIAWQVPEMARFMQPSTTWYHVQSTADVISDFLYLFGGVWWALAAPVLLLMAVCLGLFSRSAAEPFGRSVIWGAVASVLGAGVLIALGTQRPMMTARYLAPFAPGFWLSLLILLRVLARGHANALRLGLLTVMLVLVGDWIAHGANHPDTVVEALNYEDGSRQIMNSPAKTVVFTWDNPNASAMHPEQLAEFGGFFFKRARAPIAVTPLQLRQDQDPNAQLVNAARPSNAAIIWVFDTGVAGTAAETHPPRIEQLAPSWMCNMTGSKTMGVVTCLPRPNH